MPPLTVLSPKTSCWERWRWGRGSPGGYIYFISIERNSYA